MASTREIAERSGVSQATVSRVLNGRGQVHPDTRARVLAAAREIGYRTQTEREGLHRIALVYPGPLWLGADSPFDAAVAKGLSRAMSEFDFDLSVIDLRRTLRPGESYLNLFQRKGISAVILRSDDQTLHVCEQIAREGMPSVLLGERSDDPTVSYVNCVSSDASREIVEHLITLGHERIALCVNNAMTTDHWDRMQGWREARDRRGLPHDDSLLVRLPASLDNGATLLRRLMSMDPRPTAVFVTDPLLGVGLINEANRMGVQVPADLSIAGLDDSSLRLMTYPDMTSVCQDASELARRAVAALRRIVDGDSEGPIRVESAAWVEIRGSSGPPLGASRGSTARPTKDQVHISPRTGFDEGSLTKGETS